MKISNNMIAALALILIIISVVFNFIVFIKTSSQDEISGRATGTGIVRMCVNNAPVLVPLPTQNITIYEEFILFINAVDLNNQTLTFSTGEDWMNISYYNKTGNTTIGIINLTIMNESMYGDHYVRIFADDNLSCDNSLQYYDYSFSIRIPNRAPVLIADIPDFTWLEDTSLTGLDLDDYFTDPDGDTLNYTFDYVANIDVTIDSNNVITFTPNPNWYGLRTIIFWANDSINATPSNVVHLIVTNAPEPTTPSGGGGGGGGGGGPGSTGGITYECTTNWWCTDWSECLPNGTMIRECFDLNNCPEVEEEEKPDESMSCAVFPHCFNGIKDEDEEGVDCGGKDCAPCESCYDGIQNQGEEGVDCGGPCPPCERKTPTITCVNVTRQERDILQIAAGDVSPDIKLPDGYSIAVSPFNLHCHGRSYELTVSVPDNFVDVRILRCTGKECYPTKLTEITELECGGEIMEELSRKEAILSPEFMPITVEKVNLTLRSFEEVLKSGSNKVRFYGEAFVNIDALLEMPEEAVPQPKNPSLKIIGTPIDISISRPGNGSLGSIITMPYVRSDEIDEDSIAMYARISEDEWDYIGGILDKNLKQVTANITDIDKYVIDGKAKFALMGILCVNCLNSTFLKVHEPTKPSRDAIILIHGLAASPVSYQAMIDDIKLTDQPFQTWVFGYPSFKGVEVNTKDLMHHLEAHSSEYDRVFIVAHSIGGLIAQRALYRAYIQNKEEPGKYTYADKIKKMILVGVPNEGTQAAQVYNNLFKYLINLKSSFSMFRLDDVVLQELVAGIITPRVPGVKYYVVAGTKPYEFNVLFFKTTTAELLEIYEDNDGVVTVRSAQRVGEDYIKNRCVDFWTVNVTHTGLISEPVARKVIERIITEHLLADTDKPLLGHTNYYKFPITDCLPDDQFIIIGKRIKQSEVFDPTGCLCGNGICGVGENAVNCPQDCAAMFARGRRGIVLLSVIILLALVLIILTYKITRPFISKQVSKIKQKIKAFKEKMKKKEVVTEKSLMDTILQKLDNLEKKIAKGSLENLSKEFSVITREFFRQQFDIEYEFTYEELEKELKLRKIDTTLANVIGSFFKRIGEIEFGGGSLTKDELMTLIVEMREIVELTTKKTHEKIVKHVEEKSKEDKGEGKKKNVKERKAKKVKTKATGTKRIYILISKAEVCLRENKLKAAKMLYYDIYKTYNKLPTDEKKKTYEITKRLYGEIKLAYDRSRK